MMKIQTLEMNAHKAALWPIKGIVLFGVLYLLAAQMYPGGSQADKYAEGFSWVHNYWCNLLNEKAINGEPNTAKPIAMIGMAVLCASLMCFWVVFPICVQLSRHARRIVQGSGIMAMCIAFFLFSDMDHDLLTNFATFFGLIALIGTYVGLYRAGWGRHLTFGLIHILLVFVNTYVYYHRGMIVYLPVIQKISFVLFLCWVCSICARMRGERST